MLKSTAERRQLIYSVRLGGGVLFDAIGCDRMQWNAVECRAQHGHMTPAKLAAYAAKQPEAEQVDEEIIAD
eukprot:3549115-Pyramimonas_sp.AAC.1